MRDTEYVSPEVAAREARNARKKAEDKESSDLGMAVIALFFLICIAILILGVVCGIAFRLFLWAAQIT